MRLRCTRSGGLNEWQQSAPAGSVEAPSPPISPDFLLDYLLFDGEQEIDGRLLSSDRQVNDGLFPALLPSSSDFPKF